MEKVENLARIEEVAGQPVFRIESNIGTSFDDYLATSVDTLNDAPVKIFKDRVIGQGGVFSDNELKVGLELGHVKCEPRPTKINGSSIDVRIGENFYLAGDARNISAIFNPFEEADVKRYFGRRLTAEPLKFTINKVLQDIRDDEDLSTKEKRRRLKSFEEHENLQNVDEDHPLILLRPRERILAHTHEFIGILPPGTTSMQSRSTTGRIGVASCFCAGWGDPGYVNRWTMEVNNLNEREYVPLPIYYRIAQIVFLSTGPVAVEYAQSTGKYQALIGENFEELQASWEASSMLPKSFKDAADLKEYRAQQLAILGQ